MGASRIERICSELIKHGMSHEMPVAVIENGTLPEQRTITGKLDDIAGEFHKENFHHHECEHNHEDCDHNHDK